MLTSHENLCRSKLMCAPASSQFQFPMEHSYYALLAAIGIGTFIVWLLHTLTAGPRLPPGPTISWFGFRCTGVKMPTAYPWLEFAKWQKTFGDMIYVNVFRNPILIVNSAEAAQDLLETKSAIYSSRPVRTMQSEVMGFSWLFSGMPYGPLHRQHRAMFRTHFQAKVMPKYHPTLVNSAHTLLQNLVRTPDDLVNHLRRTTTAIVLEVCYGHRVAAEGDEYVKLADEAITGVSQSAQFGAYLVDYIPLLKYVPAWMPGAQFQRDGLKSRKLGHEMLSRPFEMVKEQLANGRAEPCMITAELESATDSAHEMLIKGTAATAYAGGSDTTLSILMSFILAMVLHPEIQARAQAELDRVVPGDRLPTFADRTRLPFIECIVWECLRWHPVANLALAHYSTEDDTYRGFRIPRGTTVLANIWAMLHEPSRYPSPSLFNPDRYSGPNKSTGDEINPLPDLAYGFGRRICPGRFLATDTIWIVVASVLDAYNIVKPLDKAGNEHEPRVEYTPGMFSRPMPFEYRIAPRSAKAAALIEQMVETDANAPSA
ncbi:cytochrome P450 [Mycena sp. CBHHK59/15]|nr:cytochrome P450 [Mycena sp. CBHHK59/15]